MRKMLPAILATGFLAVLIWLLVSLAARTSRGTSGMPLYSAYRFDPYGSAALAQFLRESPGSPDVTLLTHPIIPNNAHGVLINLNLPYHTGMLENYSISPHYNPPLLHWIVAGNTLIDFTQNATDLTNHFKLRIEGLVGTPSPASDRKSGKSKQSKHSGTPGKSGNSGKSTKKPSGHPDRPHKIIPPRKLPKWITFMQRGDNPNKLTKWLHNIPWNAAGSAQLPASRRKLQLLAPAYIYVPPHDQHWHILAKMKSGPVAVERRLGKGRVIIIGSTWPALNGGIAQAGNLDFLLHLIGRRPVILNQWSLGVGDNFTILQLLRQFGLLPAVLQLILLLVAFAWSRRGYPPASATGSGAMARSSVEHIAILGRLYEYSLDEWQILERVRREIFHRLATALHCRPDQVPLQACKQTEAFQRALEHITDQLQAVDNDLRKSSRESDRHKSARHRLLADLMTQSWQLAKEIQHGRHPERGASANH